MSYRFRRFIAEGERAAARYVLTMPRRAAAGSSRLGRRSGSSLEFQEHRQYQPGDDLRHLDWSAYARSDRLMVKLYREEVQPHVDLLLDGSRSMALAGTDKAGTAMGLMAFFARAAVHAGLSHAAWQAGEGCQRLAAPGESAHQWRGLDFESRDSLPMAVDRLPPRWRPGGIRILISDLLWPDEPRRLLARMARGAAAVWVVQVLSEVEIDPTPAGFSRLEDAETGEHRDLLLDRSAIERYRRAFAAHRDGWRQACRQVGARHVTLTTETLAGSWAPDVLVALEHQGMVEMAARGNL